MAKISQTESALGYQYLCDHQHWENLVTKKWYRKIKQKQKQKKKPAGELKHREFTYHFHENIANIMRRLDKVISQKVICKVKQCWGLKQEQLVTLCSVPASMIM